MFFHSVGLQLKAAFQRPAALTFTLLIYVSYESQIRQGNVFGMLLLITGLPTELCFLKNKHVLR